MIQAMLVKCSHDKEANIYRFTIDYLKGGDSNDTPNEGQIRMNVTETNGRINYGDLYDVDEKSLKALTNKDKENILICVIQAITQIKTVELKTLMDEFETATENNIPEDPRYN